MLYFDHSATTPIDPSVLSLMNGLNQKMYGNPSSVYDLGRNAKNTIEIARRQFAESINCEPKEIIFTGGGSEANNIVLWNMLHQKRNHVITSSIEHPAILLVLKELEKLGVTHTIIPVDNNGNVNPEDIKNNITPDTGLITIMMANNEVGTIEPIEDIAIIAKDHDILFHSDAIQVLGKLPVDVKKLNVDMMSFSAHKFYGPKGVGALFLKNGVNIKPMIIGGSQEKKMRAGTENVSGIAGLGLAAEIARKSTNEVCSHLVKLENHFRNRILEINHDIIFNGNLKNNLPGLINLTIPNISSDLLLIHLDKQGIAISNGSACSSGTIRPSPILKAMGVSDKNNLESIRISAGKHNTIDEVDKLVDSIASSIMTIRKNSS
ncbi:MAG: cysteine desulfurase family protein [Candidatus Neomarinimicrobiota bacterium]|nr:cysteine desulfurase family protein [Candidatus Neomarinimicrobiota bacterium]